MRVLLILFFFGEALGVRGQSLLKGSIYSDLEITNSITKAYGDSIYQFHVKVLDDEMPNLKGHQRFYWFYQGEVKNTVGAYSGKVLHGIFEKFDRKNNLLEKGTFQSGLKVGEWRHWYSSGNLFSVYHWSDGLRKGDFEEFYENGQLKRQGNFRNDKIHKRVLVYNPDGSLSQKEFYKNGLVKVKKVKKSKPKKEKAQVTTQPEVKETDMEKISTPDSTQTPSSKPKKRALRRAKKNQPDTAHEKD